jgi:uncharacterized iron-regulated membrane protein
MERQRAQVDPALPASIARQGARLELASCDRVLVLGAIVDHRGQRRGHFVPVAGNLLHRIAGETPPASPTGGRPQPAEAKPGRMDPSIKMAGVDQALRVAQQHSEGWRSVSLMMPQSAESPLVFTLDHGTGRQPQKRSQLTLSRGGDVIRWEPFASQSMGRRLRALARFGHTGEAAGILGQSIAGLASAGTLVLVWTGFALSWRRLIPTRRRAMTEISADVRPLQPV